MVTRKVGLVAVIGMVALLGCAQKRDLPPRGTAIGSAEFSSALTSEYAKVGFKSENQCLQTVQYVDGTKAIELSSAPCPASGLTTAPVVAVFKLYSDLDAEVDADATYLVMGNSQVLDQNTAVATAKNLSAKGKPITRIEVGDLCVEASEYEEDFTAQCKVNFGKTGFITSITFNKARPFNRTTKQNELVHRRTLRSQFATIDQKHIELQKNIDTVQTNLTAVDTKLTGTLATLRTEFEATAKALQAKDIQLDALIAGLDTKLGNTKTELQAEDKRLAELITALNTKVEDLTKADIAIRNEMTEKVAGVTTELAKAKQDLTKEITTKVDAVKAELNTAKQKVADEIGRVEGLITTLRSDMDRANAAAKAASKNDLETIRGELAKAVKDANDAIGTNGVIFSTKLNELKTTVKMAELDILSLQIEAKAREITQLEAHSIPENEEKLDAARVKHEELSKRSADLAKEIEEMKAAAIVIPQKMSGEQVQ